MEGAEEKVIEDKPKTRRRERKIMCSQLRSHRRKLNVALKIVELPRPPYL